MEKQRSLTVNVNKGCVITKANALIEASYILSLNEQRLILACAAKLDGRKPMPRDTVFEISADEFVALFDTDPRNAYTEMESAVSKLFERDINRIEGMNRKRLRWVYMAEYKKGEGKVRLGFSPDIAPYLTMLNKKFTSYSIEEVCRLRSNYAIRLYEMLVQFLDTGVFWITVETFKMRLELEEKYDRFSNLRVRVIEPAIKDITAKTNLDVRWQGHGAGRTVSRLEFRFSLKKQMELALEAPGAGPPRGGAGIGLAPSHPPRPRLGAAQG